MDLCLKLPESLGISCNRESLLSPDDFEALHACVQLVLAPQDARDESERRFVAEWVKGFAAASHFAKGAQPQFRGGELAKALDRLCACLRNDDERLTAYKVIFLAAVHSTRDASALAVMVGRAHEELRLDG